MNQRLALLLAGTLTAFMLVLMGGVAATMLLRAPAPAEAQVAPAPVQPPAQPVVAPPLVARLTPDQATRIAQTTLPRTRLTRAPELVNYNGAVAYEVILDRGTVYVDANSGAVLANSATQTTTRVNEHRGEKDRHGDDDEEDDDD